MGLFDSISLNENEGGRLLKRASVSAKARFDAQFGKYIESATSPEEKAARFDQIREDVMEMARVVAAEQGVSEKVVFDKIAVDVLGESPHGLDAPDLQVAPDDDSMESKRKQIAEILGIDPSKVDMAALEAAMNDFNADNPISDEDQADMDNPEERITRPPGGEGAYLARRSDAVHDSVFSVLAAEFGDTSVMERTDVSTGEGPIPVINTAPVGDGLSPIEVPSVVNPQESIGITDPIEAQDATEDIAPMTQTERVDIENAPAEQTGDATSVFPAGNQAQPVTSSSLGEPNDYPRPPSPAVQEAAEVDQGWVDYIRSLIEEKGLTVEKAMEYLQRPENDLSQEDGSFEDDPDPTGSGEAFGDNRNPEGLSVKNYTSNWRTAGPGAPVGEGWMNFPPQPGKPTFEWDKRPPEADKFNGRVDEDHYQHANDMRSNPALYVNDLFQQGLTYQGVVYYLMDFLGYDRPEAEQLVAQHAPEDERANESRQMESDPRF